MSTVMNAFNRGCSSSMRQARLDDFDAESRARAGVGRTSAIRGMRASVNLTPFDGRTRAHRLVALARDASLQMMLNFCVRPAVFLRARHRGYQPLVWALEQTFKRRQRAVFQFLRSHDELDLGARPPS